MLTRIDIVRFWSFLRSLTNRFGIILSRDGNDCVTPSRIATNTLPFGIDRSTPMIPREAFYFLMCAALLGLTLGYVLVVRDAERPPWAVLLAKRKNRPGTDPE